jgi:hypothetical protein
MFDFISALTPQSKDILEKLIVAQPNEEFEAIFLKTQAPATGSCEPDESHPISLDTL